MFAYHGTCGLGVVKNILEKGFQSGSGQTYCKSENMNPLTNKSKLICDIGVYITCVIEEAEKYSSYHPINFENNTYYFVFMCRINHYM